MSIFCGWPPGAQYGTSVSAWPYLPKGVADGAGDGLGVELAAGLATGLHAANSNASTSRADRQAIFRFIRFTQEKIVVATLVAHLSND